MANSNTYFDKELYDIFRADTAKKNRLVVEKGILKPIVQQI